MRIKQYQVGGGIAYLPTTSRSGAAARQPAAASDSEGNSKVPGFAKEVISIVKENGLDSDVQVFLNQVGRVLDLANDPTGENLTLREILKIQRLASNVKTNYEDYKKAEEKLNAQDAWGEMAINSRGQLYVKDTEEGGLKTINPSDFDPERYIALTNGDLLNIRRLDPTLAYRTDLLDSAGNAVGMNSIVDQALKVIEKFGKTTITGYSEKQSNKIKSGLQHIVAADIPMSELIAGGPDGVYKISSETTIADSGIREALNYLYTTMPNEYKNTLRAKAAVEGYNPDAMLLQMIYYNSPRSLTADYDESVSKAAGYGAEKSDKTQYVPGTLPDQIARGRMKETTAYLSPEAERVADTSMMAVQAWNAGPIMDKSGQALGQNNLDVLLQEGYSLLAGDRSMISFGNQPVKDYQQKGIVYDGRSQLKRVALPKMVASDGTIMPDMGLMLKYNEVLRYAKDHPGISKMEIKQKLGEYFQDCVITDNNDIIIRPDKMGMFLTFAAYASKDIVPIEDESKRFLDHLSRAEGKSIKDTYNKLVEYGKLAADKKSNAINAGPGVGNAGNNDFYYGNVYMAITDSTQGFLLSNNELYPKETFTHVTEKAALNDIVVQNQMIDPYQVNFID